MVNEIEIDEILIDDDIEIDEIKLDVIKILPALEDLEITPSGVEQIFKSEKYYGYNEIKVKKVESETLNAVPTEDNQTITGLFGIVNIEKIPEKYVVPEVVNQTLILSRGSVKEGRLIL